MFTGIVQGQGTINSITKERSGFKLTIQTPLLRRVDKGASVSVNGVCLTVAKKEGNEVTFDVMEETIRKTTLGAKNKGDRVNMERALRVGDEVGGHFVYGHISAIAEIRNPKSEIRNGTLLIKPPRELMKYIVPQGSVAIDGVSLTLARVGKDEFTVALVDYTLKHTTLGALKKGDTVNIEVDMMAKYVQKMIHDR